MTSHAIVAVASAAAASLLCRTTARQQQHKHVHPKQAHSASCDTKDGGNPERAQANDDDAPCLGSSETKQHQSVDLDSEDGSEVNGWVPFSSWAAAELLGCEPSDLDEDTSQHGTPSAFCSEIREALRTIAGLYMRADVASIRAVIEHYRLADILTRYLLAQYRESHTLAGLGLQLSKAFVVDALSSEAGTHASDNDAGNTVAQAAAPQQRESGAISPEDAARALHTASSNSSRTFASPMNSTKHMSRGFGRRGLATKSCGPRQYDELAQARRMRDSQACSLRRFGTRTILLYLMQELEALLTQYLSTNWHDMDMVRRANELDLRDEGLVCVAPGAATATSESNAIATSGGDNKTQPDGSEDTLARAASAQQLGSSPPASHASRRSLQALSGSSSSMASSEGSRSSSSGSKAWRRARRNWQRAFQAHLKHAAVNFLRPQREFRTMAQLMQQLHKPQPQHAPNRRPVFLFLGGGMAAGKSTVREIIGSNAFWSSVGKEAVVIEADAIKNQDVVYQELKDNPVFQRDDSTLSQFVHEYSTRRANAMLVAAVNAQKDIIFDGTCSWAPFVEQTIEMLRAAHENDFELGPGYSPNVDGSVCERYWQRRRPPAATPPQSPRSPADNHNNSNESPAQSRSNGNATQHGARANGQHGNQNREQGQQSSEPGEMHDAWSSTALIQSSDRDAPSSHTSGSSDDAWQPARRPAPCPHQRKQPYTIELVGVTCAPQLAVARGFWRHLRSGRGVPVQAQLRSHRLFAENWATYCKELDSATLYHTGTDLTTLTKDKATPPRVIAHKSSATCGELLVEPQAYNEFKQQAHLRDDAGGEDELYSQNRATHCTHEVLRCPSQKQDRLGVLRAAFEFANDERSDDNSRSSTNGNTALHDLQAQRHAYMRSSSEIEQHLGAKQKSL